MYSLNLSLRRKPGHEQSTATIDGILEYESNNLEKVMVQVKQMNNYIENLQKSLGELESKVQAYHNIILKYESIFQEELSLYRLEKSKMTTMQEAFHSQQSFTKEIEQQVSNFINDYSSQDKKYSAFKRIVFRFFHQNKLNQSSATTKITEIDELIDKKQQLLEKFQTDVKNWKKRISLTIPASEAQPMALN